MWLGGNPNPCVVIKFARDPADNPRISNERAALDALADFGVSRRVPRRLCDGTVAQSAVLVRDQTGEPYSPQLLLVSADRISLMTPEYGLTTDQQFNDSLQKSGLTRADMEARLRDTILMNKVFGRELRGREELTDKELRERYDREKEHYRLPERARLREIVTVATDENDFVNGITSSGAAYVFGRTGTTWTATQDRKTWRCSSSAGTRYPMRYAQASWRWSVRRRTARNDDTKAANAATHVLGRR